MHLSYMIMALGLTGRVWSEDISMAGVAFLWPPDRAYSTADDNTAPCGSSQGVTNRTDFPTSNGAIALVAQDESWNIQVSVSHDSNPTSNSDFTTVISSHSLSSMEPGHECLPLAAPSSSATKNSGNATIQIKYTSDLYDDKNETYYACADIRYVAAADFHTDIPCFNVSVDNATESGGNSSSDENGAGMARGSMPGLVGSLVLAAVVVAVGFV